MASAVLGAIVCSWRDSRVDEISLKLQRSVGLSVSNARHARTINHGWLNGRRIVRWACPWFIILSIEDDETSSQKGKQSEHPRLGHKRTNRMNRRKRERERGVARKENQVKWRFGRGWFAGGNWIGFTQSATPLIAINGPSLFGLWQTIGLITDRDKARAVAICARISDVPNYLSFLLLFCSRFLRPFAHSSSISLTPFSQRFPFRRLPSLKSSKQR